MYPRALIFLAIEANMSFVDTDRIGKIARKISPFNMRVTCQDPKGKGRTGVWTGENEKGMYANSIRDALVSKTLFYVEDSKFVSANAAKTQLQFEKQLQVFRRIVKPAVNKAFDKPKITYSGEGKDDLVIACGMCLHFSYEIRCSEEYNNIAQSSGFID